MKCYVVKDLLPSYIEGLLSEETQKDMQEHLSTCDDCKMSYVKMKEPIPKQTQENSFKEVDFLKKIRTKSIRNIVIVSVALIVVFVIVAWIFAIGRTAYSEDVNVTTEFQQQENAYLHQGWVINFELTNGKALNTKIVYTDEKDENGKIKTSGCVITLYEVQPSKLLAEGNEYSYGYSLYGNEAPHADYDFTITVRYRDKEVVYSMRDEGLFVKR